MNLLALLRNGVLALALGAMGSLNAAAAEGDEAAGGVSTADIVSTTIGAASTCLRFTLRGACVWLRCTPYGCKTRVTVRVQHMQPDLAISTFHEYAAHPWTDYGRTVANAVKGAGNSLMRSAGGAAQSLVGDLEVTGTRAPNRVRNTSGPKREGHNLYFRGADAIGNPGNIVSCIFNGDCNPAAPDSVAIPMPFELMAFFSDWSNQVSQQWSEVPSSYSSTETDYAAEQMQGASQWLSQAGQLVSAYQSYSSSLNGQGGANSGFNVTGGDSQGSGDTVGTNTGGNEYFCPPGVIPFGLPMHSELDVWFWRGIIPLESLYPATWLPGMREVGSGLAQTWGSVYPRQGAVFQQHPVKASAVLAQRVGDIVTRRAQPHIYSALDMRKSGWRWFGEQGIREHNANQTIWQRIYPNPDSSCRVFGSNDSLSLTSFGDNNVSSREGYLWVPWRRQECCYAPAGYAFIGSVGI